MVGRHKVADHELDYGAVLASQIQELTAALVATIPNRGTTMNLRDLKASDIMVRPVVTATRKASARDIGLQLLTGLYSGMPIADDAGRVVGIVTEYDLLNAAKEGKELLETPAEQVMSTEGVTTADVDTPVSELIKMLTNKNIIRVPITDKGNLVGVVARCDVLKALIEPEFVTYALGTRRFWRGMVPPPASRA